MISHDNRMAVANGSITLWYYDTGPYANEMFFSKDCDTRATGGGLYLGVDHNKAKVRLESTTTDYKIEIDNAVSMATWTHIVFTFGSAGMKLYVNGALIGANAYTGGMTGNSEPIVLGASQESRKATDLPNLPIGFYTAGLNNFFSGRLDEVAFFDRALSASEVSRLYASRMPAVRVLQWQY